MYPSKSTSRPDVNALKTGHFVVRILLIVVMFLFAGSLLLFWNSVPSTDVAPPVCGIQEQEFKRQLAVMIEKRDTLQNAINRVKGLK